jgi:hypothetical protein
MAEIQYRFRLWGTLTLLALVAALAARGTPRSEPTVEELKGRLASASIRDRPHLCVQIAEKQLAEADKSYAASEFEKGQAGLTDVVAFSELARDYAVQSHKHQKDTEIAVRNMTRKLNDLLHSLGGSDQGPVRDAINRLQRVRDDLLASMFPKGGAK